MLQCISEVPADLESRNLGVMRGVCVCVYSDKQSGNEIRIILACKLKEKWQVGHKNLLSI